MKPFRLRTWLQLLRAPNLFTVPGDPTAGYLISNSFQLDWTLGAAIAASLCFYSAGLLMNDLADEKEDRLERPNRPLPSGAASRGSVWIALIVLCAAGLGALASTQKLPAILIGLALVLAITFYNFWTKHIPVIGALNMGVCRTLSVITGAVVGPMADFNYKLAMIPAAILGLYIAAVTNLARHETRDRVPVIARVLPVVAMLFACIGGTLYDLTGPATTPAVAIYALAALMAVWLVIKLFKKPGTPLPPLIGAHIRLLLPLQAALCYTGDSPEGPFTGDPWCVGRIAAFTLLVFWPISRVVSKRFYAS